MTLPPPSPSNDVSLSVAGPRVWFVLALALGIVACTRGETTQAPGPKSDPPKSVPSASGPIGEVAARTPRMIFDPLANAESCSLGHRGLLLDLGTESGTRHVTSRARNAELESVEREGATFARVRSRTLSLTMFATSEDVVESAGDKAKNDGVAVTFRVRGGSAKGASVLLNGRNAGIVSFTSGETTVVSVRAPSLSLAGGANELTLNFRGGPAKGDPGVQAEIDWVHVGDPTVEASLWAPTFATSIGSATVGNASRPAVSIRSPGFLRCTTWIPHGASLSYRVGWTGGNGTGEATARVRLLRDRLAPIVLSSTKLSVTKPVWTEVNVALPEEGERGTLATLEFAVPSAPEGSRISFAEPKVTVPVGPPPTKLPPVRGVVLVVMSGLSTKTLSVYGGSLALPSMQSVADGGTVFEAHRGSTASASGNFASMLTGLAPRSHAVTDGDARLSPNVALLSEIVHHAGIATAFFSANPGTSAPFGFARGWDAFVSAPPTDNQPQRKLFEEAARYIDEHKGDRFFVTIHARGGHPPWDVTAEELRAIGPQGYTGPVDPRSAGELLSRSKKPPTRLTDADRGRAMALQARALGNEDAQLGTLLASLRASKRDIDTMVIVTGDVAMDERSPAPFSEGDISDEAVLSLPLVVRRPGTGVGQRVKSPTDSTDIATTVLSAFALTRPRDFIGVDLSDVATQPARHEGRVLVAESESRFSVRRGALVLIGSFDRDVRLCDLSLEPACVTDVRATYPLAYEGLRSSAFELLGDAKTRRAREPAPIDSMTASSLHLWGR